jgi:AraC-like DNA-binding protein
MGQLWRSTVLNEVHGNEAWLFASPLVRVSSYRCGTPVGETREKVVGSHTIVLPAQGSCLVESEGQRAISDPSTFLYLNAESPVTTTHRTGPSDSGHLLVLRPDLLLDTPPGEAPRDPRRPFPRLQAESSSAAFLTKHLLLARIEGRNTAEPMEIEEIALRLAHEALSLQRDAIKESRKDARQRRCVDEAKAFLSERFADPIHLEDVARVVSVSPFHLCRIFKAQTGLTIHRYLTRLRLRASLDRVQDPRGNLLELALDLGFSSHSHFSYAFRREFKMSPTAFRTTAYRSHRGGSSPEGSNTQRGPGDLLESDRARQEGCP